MYIYNHIHAYIYPYMYLGVSIQVYIFCSRAMELGRHGSSSIELIQFEKHELGVFTDVFVCMHG